MLNGCRKGCCSTSSLTYVPCKLRVLMHGGHALTGTRIIPKLNAEIDVHLSAGGAANSKRGTLDVHRGGMIDASGPHVRF